MVDANNNADINARKVENPAEDTPNENYTNAYFDGHLPGAIGTIAKTFRDKEPGPLKELCTNFYNFLKEPSPNLHQLSNDNNFYTALILLTLSLQCRLLYGFGIGSSPIGCTSNMDGQLLALYQEGNRELGPPLPIMFPPAMINVEE